MDKRDFLKAKNMFTERLKSLQNDAIRAFTDIKEIAPAPFPIAMYTFATIDYFSSFWRGWNQHSPQGQNQTKRIVDFLEEFLEYPREESFIAVNIWRHKLIHTAEPRIVKDKNSNKRYGWLIGPRLENHWELQENHSDYYVINIGIFNLIDDLKEGIFGRNGYFNKLKSSSDLQRNWKNMMDEISTYEVDLTSI